MPVTPPSQPQWTLMLNPDTDEIHAIRCRFAQVKVVRGWKIVACETEFLPWPTPPMDMNLLSGPKRTDDEPEDDGA